MQMNFLERRELAWTSRWWEWRHTRINDSITKFLPIWLYWDLCSFLFYHTLFNHILIYFILSCSNEVRVPAWVYQIHLQSAVHVRIEWEWVLELVELKPLTSKHYSSAPIHLEIFGEQQSLYLKLGRDLDNNLGLPTITICLPILAL